jgi:hypothetical protein
LLVAVSPAGEICPDLRMGKEELDELLSSVVGSAVFADGLSVDLVAPPPGDRFSWVLYIVAYTVATPPSVGTVLIGGGFSGARVGVDPSPGDK